MLLEIATVQFAVRKTVHTAIDILYNFTFSMCKHYAEVLLNQHYFHTEVLLPLQLDQVS